MVILSTKSRRRIGKFYLIPLSFVVFDSVALANAWSEFESDIVTCFEVFNLIWFLCDTEFLVVVRVLEHNQAYDLFAVGLIHLAFLAVWEDSDGLFPYRDCPVEV